MMGGKGKGNARGHVGLGSGDKDVVKGMAKLCGVRRDPRRRLKRG